MTSHLNLYVATLLVILGTVSHGTIRAAEPDKIQSPNFVVIFCDDLGYGDLGCFGAKGWQTPNLDRMAAEGIRFTDFHTPAAVCSASRAALMTGCYPQRVGILGALGPQSKIGISDDEMLLPELLKKAGYATAIYGKWHLGHHPQFLPTRHGFDEWFGLPYSNDMWPLHPTAPKGYPALPLFENEQVKIAEVTAEHQTQFTTWYTEHAVQFIEKNKDRPFFLYVPHSMPHVPLYVSDKFKGKSKQGPYGDVVMEIDWGVGQILDALKKHGLDEKTLVFFTSDNGPWLSYGNHAGGAGPLREGKGTTWEGGQRVPLIARWPKAIPAGKVCDEFCTTMDILPTLAVLAGIDTPKFDGHEIVMLLSGEEGVESPHDVFYYYWDYGLEGVRSGPWKLVFPHEFRSLTGKPGHDGQPNGYTQQKAALALYNLATDIGEKQDVAAEHPDIVARLERLAEAARDDLGDSLQKRPGKNRRSAGKLRE